jgi:ribosomal protein L32
MDLHERARSVHGPADKDGARARTRRCCRFGGSFILGTGSHPRYGSQAAGEFRQKEEVSQMAKKPTITVCPNCGSTDLGWVGGGANAVFDFTGASALSGLSHCANCGRDILPIEFASEAAYKKFVASLKKRGASKAEEAKPAAAPAQGGGISLASGYAHLVAAAFFAIAAIASFFISIRSGQACFLLPAVLCAAAAAYLFLKKQP